MLQQQQLYDDITACLTGGLEQSFGRVIYSPEAIRRDNDLARRFCDRAELSTVPVIDVTAAEFIRLTHPFSADAVQHLRGLGYPAETIKQMEYMAQAREQYRQAELARFRGVMGAEEAELAFGAEFIPLIYLPERAKPSPVEAGDVYAVATLMPPLQTHQLHVQSYLELCGKIVAEGRTVCDASKVYFDFRLDGFKLYIFLRVV